MGTRKGTRKGRRGLSHRRAVVTRPQEVVLDSASAADSIWRPWHSSRGSQTDWLRFYEARYAATKNPIFVGEAIALSERRPLPPWVHGLSRSRGVGLSCHVENESAPRGHPASRLSARWGSRRPKASIRSASSVTRITMCRLRSMCTTKYKAGEEAGAWRLMSVARAHPARCPNHPPLLGPLAAPTVYRCWEEHKSRVSE